MLEKLITRNFQRHKKLVLELDPQVTTLVGSTDAGKSAVLRLLRWIATNRPSGDAFMRHGADYVSGTLHVDGHVIKRQRSGGHNAYYVDDQEYQAFGTGIPDEVAGLLNIDEVSWQGQLDPPFLFALTAAETARELNRVVALDLIDAVLATLAAEVRRSSDAVKNSEDRLREAQERHRMLSWVEEADAALRELEAVEGQRQEAQIEVDDLQTLLEYVTEATAQRDAAQETIIALEELVAAGERAQAAQRDLDALQALVEEVGARLAEVTQLQQQAQDQEEALRQEAGDRCPLCSLEGGELL